MKTTHIVGDVRLVGGVSRHRAGQWFWLCRVQEVDRPEPLLRLVAHGDTSEVHAALDSGADIAIVDGDGAGVLRYALGNANLDVLELLLDCGPDLNAPSTSASMQRGMHILHAFSEHGWDDRVRLLVAHGAAVNATGAGGVTSTMLAAGIGNVSSVIWVAPHACTQWNTPSQNVSSASVSQPALRAPGSLTIDSATVPQAENRASGATSNQWRTVDVLGRIRPVFSVTVRSRSSGMVDWSEL